MARRFLHPFFPLTHLRQEIDRLFANGGSEGVEAPRFWVGREFPTLNVWEDEQHLYAEAELPGIPQESLDISVLGNELTIKGERRPIEEQGATYHRRERGVGTFTRTIRLPVDVNAEGIQATLSEGVLKVTLPKAESVKPRKIPVEIR